MPKNMTKEKAMIMMLYYTGLRRGEALALTIHDVDMELKKLKVNKSLDISENTPEIKEPKTKAGYREIPIPDKLYNFLADYLKTCTSKYLFPNLKGELISHSSFTKMWKSIIRKTQATANKIGNCETITFTPHIFRHTYATYLYYAGIDVKKSQYYLGHSNVEMTLKIYTHLDNEKNDKDYFDKINNFFSQTQKIN